MSLETLFCSINELNSFLLCPIFSSNIIGYMLYKTGQERKQFLFLLQLRWPCDVTFHFVAENCYGVKSAFYQIYQKEFIRLQWNFQDDGGFFPTDLQNIKLFDIQLNTNQKRVNQCNKYSWRTKIYPTSSITSQAPISTAA